MLSQNLVGGRPQKAHRRQLNTAPARAGHVYYVGAAASFDAEGFLVPGAAGVRAAGVIVEGPLRDTPDINVYLDNTHGTDGHWQGDQVVNGVRYDQVGEYAFASIQGTPVAGAPAFLVDSDTVSAAPTDKGLVLGVFTRPTFNGWYVDLARSNPGLGFAESPPFDLIAPVVATLASDSAAVNASDVVQLSLTEPGDFTIQAGVQSGTLSFFGVAAEAGQAGDRIRVWRGGYYPVRVQDGVVLPPFVLLGWENTGVRIYDQAGDFAAVGRALQPSTGGVGEIVPCEIWWPPPLKL